MVVRDPMNDARLRALGIGMLFAYCALRVSGSAPGFEALQLAGAGAYVHLDPSSFLAMGGLGLLWRGGVTRGSSVLLLGTLSATFAISTLHANLVRYYSGNALAWDLGNFVQPMWRSAHGQSMTVTFWGASPLWGDHGSFAMFLFAPLTRLFADPATGVLLAQAGISSAFIPALYVVARRAGLERAPSLAVSTVAASSRALFEAATFDFHQECALGLLLTLLTLCVLTNRHRHAVVLALLAASLKDMAALTAMMALLYFALRRRSAILLAGAALCAGIAAFDMRVLPSLTGWPSYVAMNTSAGLDLSAAVLSTLGRSLSQGFAGWLHPFSWFTGAPWAAAAALSPKLAVKGLGFQYGFLWAPVGLLGTIFIFSWLSRRAPQRVASAGAAWVALTLAINARPAAPDTSLGDAYAHFFASRTALLNTLPAAASIGTDACTSPLLMDRAEVRGLCLLDVAALARGGAERWSAPASRALEVDYIVFDRLCTAHGTCAQAQLEQAQRRGFKLQAIVRQRWGVFARGETLPPPAQ
jgi:uncharacterized membrane protein